MKTVVILKKEMGKSGGLEKHTLRIAEMFEKKGHPVTIFSSDNEVFAQKCKNLTLLKCPPLRGAGYRKIKQFDAFSSSFLKKNPTDLSLGMDRTSFQTHLRAGNGVHAAYLNLRREQEGFFKSLSFYLNPLHSLLLKIEKQALHHPALQKVIVNSSLVKSQMINFYAIDQKKIEILHNGVEWEEMESSFTEGFSKKEEIAKRLHLNPHLHHFLFLGHNFQRKGLKPLLVALSHLSSKKFHLSVVGEDKNISHYKKLVHSLSLTDKVSFFGKVDPVTPFYQLADTLVIPSFYDPFANVTVEALAMGLFVISSKLNGGHEVLSPYSGQVVDSLKDLSELTHALEKALETPKTIASSLLIRNSVEHLDFKYQLPKFYNLCIS